MTSTAIHPAALPIETLLADCDSRRQRRSGPGGQHRNKVETAVVLTHRPSGIQAEASERRSQEANRQQAIFRLRVNLALEIRLAEVTEADSPPRQLWQSRVRGKRISISATHDDFPALLAVALDQLAEQQWEPAPAAEVLGVTASQLLKLLRNEPRAFALVNRQRAERSLQLLK